MYKYEKEGKGKVGVTIELRNSEMMLLKDEVEDITNFFKEKKMFSASIDDMFSEENAKKVLVNFVDAEVMEMFEHIRNVYYFVNELTTGIETSTEKYNKFFGINQDD